MTAVAILPYDPMAAWPEPIPLVESLAPVPVLSPDLLPDALRPLVCDIAERMQCPVEYPAVAAVTALGSVVGRRIGVRPKARDGWTEVANVWGLIVGRPGSMKSPAISAALSPLRRLEVAAAKENDAATEAHQAADRAYTAKSAAARKAAEKKLRADPDADVSAMLAENPPKRPPLRRHVVNDITVEKLGEIVADNPNGLLAERDEIMGLLGDLRREERASARAFYLSAWGGMDPFVFDRIGRGTVRLPAVCVSVLGGTQPGKLQTYVRDALSGGTFDDGMLQRFGLLAWPDAKSGFELVDVYPDSAAKQRANTLFEQLSRLDPDDVEAERDAFDALPFLRLGPEAREAFDAWLREHEALLRSGELHPALESHLSKHRKLVPALALAFHLADGGVGPIGALALERAVLWSDVLRPHAERAYGAAVQPALEDARLIWSRICAGRIGPVDAPFAPADIQRRQWTGLKEAAPIKAALEVLAERFLIIPDVDQETGGRPALRYRINPRGLRT